MLESRHGLLGSGMQILALDSADYTLAELLFHMGLNFDDNRGIDVVVVSAGHYAIRYYDGQDQRVVAHEFDANFRFLGETRAHIAEWIGEDTYYSLFSGH